MSTDLHASISSHLAARRARGYRLEGHEQLLGAFLDSLEARGETRITVPAAVAFATAPAGTARAWHAQRLAAVRSFAGYVHALDPAAADPVPGGLIPGRIPRRVPYLYSGEETARLMAAAGTLASPVLAASMRTLIGLLASTGIRSGEAFALDVPDLDPAEQVLTVTGKHGRKRLIALHPSAASALSDYLRVPGTARRGRHRRPAHRPGRPSPQPQHGPHHLPVAGHRMRPGTPARLQVPETP
jgi:site-specific recombinase XerD